MICRFPLQTKYNLQCGQKHTQLLTIPLGRREEMNMNVTVCWVSLLEWSVSGHLIASTTEFHRILQILWWRAERQRENVEMGSFTMFVVTQVGQLSRLGGHTKPPQPFSKEWNKITPFRFRLSAVWPKYFCRVEMRWDISSKLIISWQGRADPAKSNTWDDEMSVNQRLNILPLLSLLTLMCCWCLTDWPAWVVATSRTSSGPETEKNW